MKKAILLIVAVIIFSIVAYATIPPPEFQERWQGEGYRVLMIDDFEGNFNFHGNKMFSIISGELPKLEITTVDIYEAKDFWWSNDYDIIVVFMWFESERWCRYYIPKRMLEAESLKLAPAGNGNPPYNHDNPSGRWFVTVGALDHPEWQQGEIQLSEDETYGGTCGATATAAVDAIRYMHDNECEWEQWMGTVDGGKNVR